MRKGGVATHAATPPTSGGSVARKTRRVRNMTTTSAAPAAPAASGGFLRRVSSTLYRRPRVRLGLLLSAPLFWLVIAYLGSLAAMFTTAFWSVDSFTQSLIKVFT